MQTIGLSDGPARLREFVAAFREKGLMAVHDRAAARDDRAPNGIQTSVRKTPGAKPGGPERAMSEAPTVQGTVLGAAMATYVGPHAVAFGIGLFVLGLIRIVTHSDLTGYRFGGVALAIVLLVPRTGPAWQIAFDRFVEMP